MPASRKDATSSSSPQSPPPPSTSTSSSKATPKSPSAPSVVFEAACNALLLTTTGFLLGALFMVLTTDYALLYTNSASTSEAYLRAEQTYLTLWASPVMIKALLHVTLLVPILTLAIKTSRYTEAALYFDGLCLALMLLVLGLYTGSTVPNLRKLAAVPSNEQLAELVRGVEQMVHSQGWDPRSPTSLVIKLCTFLSYPASVLLKPSKALEREEAFKKSLETNPITEQTRREFLTVTAAGHSIAMFLLIAIVLLQIGKVYAEAEDAKLKAKFEIEESKRVSEKKKQQ